MSFPDQPQGSGPAPEAQPLVAPRFPKPVKRYKIVTVQALLVASVLFVCGGGFKFVAVDRGPLGQADKSPSAAEKTYRRTYSTPTGTPTAPVTSSPTPTRSYSPTPTPHLLAKGECFYNKGTDSKPDLEWTKCAYSAEHQVYKILARVSNSYDPTACDTAVGAGNYDATYTYRYYINNVMTSSYMLCLVKL